MKPLVTAAAVLLQLLIQTTRRIITLVCTHAYVRAGDLGVKQSGLCRCGTYLGGSLPRRAARTVAAGP